VDRHAGDRLMLAYVNYANGSNVPWPDLYSRYRRWCAEQEPSWPRSWRSFSAPGRTRCAPTVFFAKFKGDEVYCLDVRASSLQTRSTQ
jgi:hypothetical protein